MAFKNPLMEKNAPDPFMTYDEGTGYYYMLFTIGDCLKIYRSRRAADILTANDFTTVFEVNANDGVYGNIWAPEMHLGSSGKWYIYTSGTTEEPDTTGQKHIFILESETADPFDGFHFKCFPCKDKFSIDPSVLRLPDGRAYLAVSEVVGSGDTCRQVVAMYRLLNDYTLSGEGGIILEANFPWEKCPPTDGYTINEGPFFVINGGRIFLFFSANGCWQNEYALGYAELIGDDPCKPESWKKHPLPFLCAGNGVYGPGHASFFRSPDKSEVWCCYHTLCESDTTNTPTDRYPNIIRVDFDESGSPVCRKTPAPDTLHPSPSGEK